MTFTVKSLSTCDGGNHITITVTIGGVDRTEVFLRSDLDLDPAEIKEAIVARCRSAAKEANASTPAQVRNALLNNTFKI